MTPRIDRRAFLRRSSGLAALAALGSEIGAPSRGEPALARSTERGARSVARGAAPKKALLYAMLPDRLSMEDRFKLARDVGFAAVEAPPIPDAGEAEKMRAAAAKAGIAIHSVIYGGWHAPLSSADPAVVERGRRDVEAALRSAHAMGAEDILLVPAVVNAETRYVHAYERSQKQIRRVIPLAEELRVMICVENVWNNFLLSPLEFARYVDEFKSPWVQAYFDVGNVVVFGWPEDWIRTLGPRIKKVHLKDFKRSSREFVNLRDGDVNWPEVRRAFAEVGFSGPMTTELGGGDEAYLRDVSARVDKILAGT
jgi:L-ribulose-5-phosphate 3-epimerase